MGKLDTMIRVVDSADRPCIVDGRKALFLKWDIYSEPVGASPLVGGPPAGVISKTLAIIEFEDGSVEIVAPWKIKFLDSKERFADIAWDEN